MADWELELIVARESEESILMALVGDEASFTKRQRHVRRVLRELARRDWRNRPHGRQCTCAECLYLLEVWQSLQRRAIHPNEGVTS